MSPTLLKFLGLAAACLTTVAYVPQVYKTWKTRSSEGLSLPMLLLFSAGVLLWLLYGIMRKDLPIIVANGCTLVLTAALLYFKHKFRDAPGK